MVTGLMLSVLSIILVIGLFALQLLSKRVHYFVGGIILAGMGVLQILFSLGIISFNISDYPVMAFAVYFMIIFASTDLLKEGFKEEQPYLKYPSIILAIVLIVVTTIPTLNNFGVISFALPEYPMILDTVLYILSGLFLFIGTFVMIKE